MTMSNTQAIGFALIPGAAESLERHAIGLGNMAWDGMAKGVKYARNALYFGVAFTAIAATGAALSGEDSTTRQYACATVATVGAGVATLAAKRLYDATSFLQSVVNSGARPT
jgi:hypothetical protein